MRLRLRGRGKRPYWALGLLLCGISTLGFAETSAAQGNYGLGAGVNYGAAAGSNYGTPTGGNFGYAGPINYGPAVQLPIAPAAVAPAPGANIPTAGGGGVAAPGAVPEWYVIPSIRIDETYNDNVNLAPRGLQVADFITAVTPGLTLIGQTPRINLNLTYDPQELLFARGTSSPILQQRLLGAGHVEVLRELLFFDANASIDQEFIRNTGAGGAIGPTTQTTSGNLQTVQSVGASPYLLLHFGPYANSETRFRFSDVTVSGNLVAPEQITEELQKISSGEYFGPAQWTILGDYTTIDRLTGTTDPLGGTSSTDAVVRADGAYPIYQALAVVGGVGYERITDPSLVVVQNGLIWNAGLQYQPNELFFARLTYGRRFEQANWEFALNYTPSPLLHVHAQYSETVQTSATLRCVGVPGAGIGTGTGTGIGPLGAVNCLNGLPIGPGNTPSTLGTSSAFGISSGSFLIKSATLGADITRERNTYGVTVYDIQQSSDNSAAFAPEKTIGASVSYGRDLSPVLKLTAGAGFFRATFQDGTGRADNSYTLSLGLNYNLSPTTLISGSISRFDNESNVAAETLVNDLIMATFRKQF